MTNNWTSVNTNMCTEERFINFRREIQNPHRVKMPNFLLLMHTWQDRDFCRAGILPQISRYFPQISLFLFLQHHVERHCCTRSFVTWNYQCFERLMSGIDMTNHIFQEHTVISGGRVNSNSVF